MSMRVLLAVVLVAMVAGPAVAQRQMENLTRGTRCIGRSCRTSTTG